MSSLWVVRAPESEGRPERFIADQIIYGLQKLDMNGMEVKSLDPNPVRGKDPVNGELFYNNLTFKTNFLQAIKEITLRVKDGDKLLFIEGMNPMISFLNYWFLIEKKTVDMYGIFHSSTHTIGDLFYRNSKISPIEELAAKSYKAVFVASAYLKNAVDEYDDPYVVQVGLPLPVAMLDPLPLPPRVPKHIIWSHRWADDKNKDVFLELAEALPNFTFTILSPTSLHSVPEAERDKIIRSNIEWVSNERWQYDEYLRIHKGIFFSCATLETFGYSFLEAVGNGWYPIVPHFASYAEMTVRKNTYPFEPHRLGEKPYRKNLIRRLVTMCQKATEGPLKNVDPLSTLVPHFNSSYGDCVNKIRSTILYD